MTHPHSTNLLPHSLSHSGANAALLNESLRIAAIDVGSNSIHMIVAQIDADGAATTLWRLKEPIGLGRMSFPSRRLSPIAMSSAVATLTRFKQAAQQRQAQHIIAVATSAVREATNGGDLLERVKREVGINLKVISARDEARLIYIGVRHAVTLGQKPHLIVDIGGGSVEFIVGDESKASMLESRKLGAARMTARYIHSDPVSPTDLAAIKRHFDRELSSFNTQVAALAPVAAIGTSGTLENIAAMCAPFADQSAISAAADGTTPSAAIDRLAFEKLLAMLLTSDSKSRSKLQNLDEQRKDQIVAGALLVGEMFEKFNLSRITICNSALREGILLDYLSRHQPDLQVQRDVPDPRRRSVLDLARRCDWHESHSEHVRNVCLRLFDDLKVLHQLGPRERELIEYASLLHDIGWHIGRTGHHKHSMYLIMHGDLKGFSKEEICIIANIARYHRKRPPRGKHTEYSSLGETARRIVDVGAAILRLADGLDRSHAGVVTGLHCRVEAKRIKCTLYARSDAELELWGARRKRKFFEKVFASDIKFLVAPRK